MEPLLVFHSRLIKKIRLLAPRPKSLILLSAVVVCSLFLLSVSRGYGFDSYQDFEKSKNHSLPLKLSSLSDKERVRSGETFWLYVVAVLDKGWHLYSLEKQSEDGSVATRIEMEKMVFDPQSSWQETPPTLVRDEVMEKIMKTHSGQVEFSRLFSVPAGLPPGVYPITGTLRFRSCDNRICTLPQTARFQTRVIVEAGEPG
ncbi:MAG: protein-disulfide reductase DsbD N-terminal domain-containing protein [Nitrospinota bacterium]|nr:protein-disulfide reductase DsbD N-terminal domain-containing protein [Nitrospinota bacterium]